VNITRLRWSSIFAAGVIGLLFLCAAGCVLTDTREDTGTSPMQDAISTAVGNAASGNWIGALVGGVGTLVGGAGAVYAQRQRKQGRKQLAEIVRGVSAYVDSVDETQVVQLYQELSKAMDRPTKDAVRREKAKLNAPG
jgi:hypothetical protein